ncbi:MAG TPA: polymer-forming cytoskeletal protein [Anaerolineaceae bacterium]|nr:polymer-forming cytoskeletal protein [Anaerolineaceae bacterium]
MFKRSTPAVQEQATPIERVNSVLGPGINWAGNLGGRGGIRIEGTFEGEIRIHGLVVIGETGRVTCRNLRANSVIVAGALRGNVTAEKLEIRSTGRVWGDVVTIAFATEEGAFLRGQVRMEEKVELGLEEPPAAGDKSEPADGVKRDVPTIPVKGRQVAGE